MQSRRFFPDDPAAAGPREHGYRWYHAVAIGVAANVPGVAVAGAMGDRAFYESLHRPRGAPPDWAFAPSMAAHNDDPRFGYRAPAHER